MLSYIPEAQKFCDIFMEITAEIQMRPDAGGYLLVKQLLDEATSFEMPDNGKIMEHDKALEIAESYMLNLPFPVCAIQYTFSDFTYASEESQISRKRISICVDFAQVQLTY